MSVITATRTVRDPEVVVTPTSVRLNVAARHALGNPAYVQWLVSPADGPPKRIALILGSAGKPFTYRVTARGMTGIPAYVRRWLPMPARLSLVLTGERLVGIVPDIRTKFG